MATWREEHQNTPKRARPKSASDFKRTFQPPDIHTTAPLQDPCSNARARAHASAPPLRRRVLDAVVSGLQTRLNGSGNLGAATVAYDGATVTVPAISTDHGQFSATVTSVSSSA